jgi:hypothetical protein
MTKPVAAWTMSKPQAASCAPAPAQTEHVPKDADCMVTLTWRRGGGLAYWRLASISVADEVIHAQAAEAASITSSITSSAGLAD